MRAFVTFAFADGREVQLGHGDMIGRLCTVACPISDPRISEAHAMVSLRGSGMHLLGLRGRFRVVRDEDGDEPEVLNDVRLRAGQSIELASGVVLDVVTVVLPDAVLGFEGEGIARTVLSGVMSIVTSPRLEIVTGCRPNADAFIWSDGEAWRLARTFDDTVGEVLAAGDEVAVGPHRLRVVAVSLRHASESITVAGAVVEAIELVVRYPIVHIHRKTQPSVTLDGLPARIIGELVAFAVPTPWLLLARELWPDDEDAALLRRRLDVALARLRKRLREVGVRADLVRADGVGNYELFLARDDSIVSAL